jgi:hypothetical protein
MTAVNVIRKPGVIHVLTCGAALAPDGKIVELQSKCVSFPTFPAAAAVTGQNLLLPTFAWYVATRGCTSFDMMVQRAPEWMSAAQATVLDLATKAMVAQGKSVFKVPTAYELVLAGWSNERQRMETYLLAGHDEGSLDGGVTPTRRGEMTETTETDGSVNPPPSAEAMAAVGLTASLDDFDPIVDGVKLMEAQRRTPALVGLWHGAPGAHVVGGYVLHTIVTRDGVRSGIIHRWPDDAIGEVITP